MADFIDEALTEAFFLMGFVVGVEGWFFSQVLFVAL